MSVVTWKAEFYPVEAEDAARGAEPQQAMEHSLLKWIGLTKSNLEKHGLFKKNNWTVLWDGDGQFVVSTDTCALCLRYHFSLAKSLNNTPRNPCADCPLVKVRGIPCDKSEDCMVRSPFTAWATYGNPMFMLSLLVEAAVMLKWETEVVARAKEVVAKWNQELAGKPAEMWGVSPLATLANEAVLDPGAFISPSVSEADRERIKQEILTRCGVVPASRVEDLPTPPGALTNAQREEWSQLVRAQIAGGALDPDVPIVIDERRE